MLDWMAWAAAQLWSFGWRLAITLACVWTVQNLINSEGYRVHFASLLIATVCAIIGIRVWMSFPNREN